MESKNTVVTDKSPFSLNVRIARMLWSVVWCLFAKPFPRGMMMGWKRFLLKCFGGKIAPTARIYSSARIWYPGNLIMEDYTCLADEVDCYNVDKVVLKHGAQVSQKTYLCTASHPIDVIDGPLITAPIIIEQNAWVTADAFVGMGVTIGKGAVVGARAAVFKDVEPWTVVGGNPAKVIKKRVMRAKGNRLLTQ